MMTGAPAPPRPDAEVTAAAILHPAADTLGGLDALLRRGRPHLSAAPIGSVVVPAALLDGFDVRGWSTRHGRGRPAGPDAPAGQVLCRVAGRATLPVQSACCVAWSAVRAAGLPTRQCRATAVVVAGNNLGLGYQARAAAAHAANPGQTRAGHLLNVFDTDALGAVGEVTGCGGEAWQIGGSSAAGALALLHGSRLVGDGHAPRCLVVAPVNELSPVEITAFVKAGAMASLSALPARGEDPGQAAYSDTAATACRPLDESRRGFAYGQMAAAMLLEPRGEAERRGLRPLGRILGSAMVADGRRGTSPSPAGQAAAMEAALSSAGLSAPDVDYVNAHATGSPIGDAAEAQALRTVFGGCPGGPWINSTKALLGHGLAAAGLVEAIATLLQLQGGYCHANPHLSKPISGDLHLVADGAQSACLRTAISNSFAFSGINASVVLGRA